MIALLGGIILVKSLLFITLNILCQSLLAWSIHFLKWREMENTLKLSWNVIATQLCPALDTGKMSKSGSSAQSLSSNGDSGIWLTFTLKLCILERFPSSHIDSREEMHTIHIHFVLGQQKYTISTYILIGGNSVTWFLPHFKGGWEIHSGIDSLVV